MPTACSKEINSPKVLERIGFKNLYDRRYIWTRNNQEQVQA